MQLKSVPVATWLLWCTTAFAGSSDDVVVRVSPEETIKLVRVEHADVRIDGQLTEAIWSTLPAYDEFRVIEPDTLVDGDYATRVRIFYDATGMYFGIEMEQPKDKLIARLSSRDKGDGNRDAINITLDTSGEGRYGYWFGLNLGDSLSDGTLLPERHYSNQWDGAWRAMSHETETGWSGEFHIPWGTLAMPNVDDVRRIGLYMSRKVAYRDERYGWPALPPTAPKFISSLQSLAVTDINPKQEYSVYPFLSVTDDRVENRLRYRAGADFFWRPSSNFQVTGSVNPDFGAVESDDVIVNLSATEVFLPEKRLFFLEGREIFVVSPRAEPRGGGVGDSGSPTTLVFTRRIGGAPDSPVTAPDVEIPARELEQPVDLQGAVKVTGQSGRLRYGVMTAFEDDVKFDALKAGDPFHLAGEGSDYGVARLLLEDSAGGAYRAVGILSTATLHQRRNAMTHGVDAHFLSANGTWKADTQLFMSDIEGVETGYGGFFDVEYTFRQGVVQGFGIEYQDEHVDINDLGFLARNDSLRVRTRHTRQVSDLTWARENEFDIRGYVQKNAAGLFTGGGVFLANRSTFENLSKLTLRANFIPAYYDDLNSFGNGSYRLEDRYFTGFRWDSDGSTPFSFGFGAGYSKEELGGTTQIGRVVANWQPSDRVRLSADIFYRDRGGWLLHQEDRNMTTFDAEVWSPKLSLGYFLTARQQFRMSLQWVGIKAREDEFFLVPESPGDLIPVEKPAGESDSFSLSQMSLQLRYRWEIAPLSDLFLVYTRVVNESSALSSFSDTFRDGYDNPTNNSLVFKLRYRFGS